MVDESDSRVRFRETLDGLPEVGDLLAGRYRLLEVLGEGGFGRVYRAQHHELSTLEVAVKVLRPRLNMDPRHATRFRREARVIAGLRGRHIVRLTDFGETDDGLLFLAMELVRGKSLEDWIFDEKERSPLRVAEITAQVLKALIEAHEHGIVHRDLKPANIMLVEEPGEAEAIAKVLDFGIAKLLDKDDDEPAVTETGTMVCTPHYASPEVLLGEAVASSDLYAVGITMIEMLEGELPYRHNNLMALAQMHMQPKPVPLGPAVLGSGLGEIIATACKKGLEQRYQAADEMLDAILDWTATQPSAPRISRPSRVSAVRRPSAAPNTGERAFAETLASGSAPEMRFDDSDTIRDGRDGGGAQVPITRPGLIQPNEESSLRGPSPVTASDLEPEPASVSSIVTPNAPARSTGIWVVLGVLVIFAAAAVLAVTMSNGGPESQVGNVPEGSSHDAEPAIDSEVASAISESLRVAGEAVQVASDQVAEHLSAANQAVRAWPEALARSSAEISDALAACSMVAVLNSEVEGVTVELDGVTLGPLPIEGAVLPATRPLSLRFAAPGHRSRTETISAAGPVVLEVSLRPRSRSAANTEPGATVEVEVTPEETAHEPDAVVEPDEIVEPENGETNPFGAIELRNP